MRLGLFSDVHTECYSDGGWPEFFKHIPYEKWDVLILAGDILNATDLKAFMLVFERICAKIRVVYVPGNHEHWCTSRHPELTWERVIYPAEEKLAGRLFALRTGKKAVIDGKTFHGDTMWFQEKPETRMYMPNWKESRFIPGFVPWVFEQNKKWKKATAEIKPGDIVVTHHTPSFKSTPEQYRDSPFNHFYTDESMESVIMRRKPALWCHGHTHEAFNYEIGSTRIACNPRGLPGQRSFYKDDLVIEL